MKHSLATKRFLFTVLASFSFSAQTLNAQSEALTTSNNSFGWSLFNEVRNSESNETNVLFSPFSAWLALTLTSNGSRGETLDEFTQVLAQKGWTREEANQATREALDSLLADKESGEKLKIANAVWVNSDIFELSAQFTNSTEMYYSILPGDDVIRSAPFSDPSTLTQMNEWVSESTEGLIPSILSKLQGDMASILLNALYFEGQWLIPFQSSLTEEKTFHKANGEDISVRMMQESSKSFAYAENDQFKMLSLAFRSSSTEDGFGISGRFVLDVVLPNEGEEEGRDLAALNQADYEGLVAGLTNTPVVVGLPRFDFDFSKSLVSSLEALGLEAAFYPGQADFTNLGTTLDKSDLFISDVLQKTAAEMDENGFKAAAVTAVIVGTTSAPAKPEKEFVADRPFFIALRDSESGLILFQGLINAPNAESGSEAR